MSLSVFDVIDQMTGYQPAAALTAAARLGIFDVLTATPSTEDDVVTALGTDPGATRALLDSIVGLQLATLDSDSRYHAEPVAERLCSGGDLRLVVEKEAFFARAWLDLADTVKSGLPRLEPWRDRLISDPAQARQFLEALVVLATETGPNLAELLAIEPGTTIADLGGGLGSTAIPLAAAGAAVSLVDLAPVTGWATEVIAGLPEAERIEVRSVDLLVPSAAQEIGDDFDVVVLSHLLHDFDDANAATVLAVARDIVRPGGAVVVVELPGDPPGAFGPMFDLMMRVETPGSARRVDELSDLMRSAGLIDVVEVPGVARPNGVFRGQRVGPTRPVD